MTSFFDEIARNKIRSLILLALFFGLFSLVIYVVVIALGGGPLAIVLCVFLIAIYAAVSYYKGGAMILAISKAQKADEKQYHYLYDVVEGLALASQIPRPDVYIINDPNPNAFATGRNKKHASIAVTSGLLTMMNKKELQGVIAHEMSHIADNDILYLMIAVIFAGVIGLVAAVVRMSFFFGGFGGGRGQNGGIIVLIALAIGLLAPLFAMLLRLAISRKREYMADANGSRLIRDPHSLASALEKIRDYGKNPQAKPVAHANDITASIYFSNPLSTKNVMNLFSTHPPIQDRIDKLEHMY